ncbi:MAG: hypothetical protein COA62_03995 [Rhodobiaceae bacterium]|nr:MAG: hypothetical protein COA62_03995 [Rhodobiaceae bacterium]
MKQYVQALTAAASNTPECGDQKGQRLCCTSTGVVSKALREDEAMMYFLAGLVMTLLTYQMYLMR